MRNRRKQIVVLAAFVAYVMVAVISLACLAGCGNVFLMGEAKTAVQTSTMDAYLASQKASIDTTTPTWVRAYLEENFRQWRFFSRAASHDPNQGPTLPSEQASTGAPASVLQP